MYYRKYLLAYANCPFPQHFTPTISNKDPKIDNTKEEWQNPPFPTW